MAANALVGLSERMGFRRRSEWPRDALALDKDKKTAARLPVPR